LKSKKPNQATSATSGSAALKAGGVPELSARHERWFRIIMVTLPVLGLALIEVLLRLAGYGYPTSYFLASRTNGTPVFIENDQFSRRYFPPGLERTPQPIVMPAVKPPNSIRIFVFGESAAMGDPEPAFGFARILDILLQAALTNQHIEVVNVAVTAINSHVIREIAKDCADKQGDYWLLYMGNNEVVGPFGAGTVFSEQAPALGRVRAYIAVKSLRIGQLLDALLQKLSVKKKTPTRWDGMEMFLQQQVALDDPRMIRVYQHFETNLRDIVRRGQKSGAQVLVSSVVSNLKDSPPFASKHRARLGAAAQSEWQRAFERGIGLEAAGNFAGALTNYQQAAQVDDAFAELAFRRGRCEAALGNIVEAREHFERAHDLDTLRFRADSRINGIVGQVSADTGGCRFVDAAALFAENSTNGLVGEELLYEHVHPNFAGNYLLARAFAEGILGSRTNTLPLLGKEECARRLAFTDFDRYRVLDEVRQRLAQPPFSTQLDQAQRERRIRAQLDRLQNSSLTAARDQYESAISRRPADAVLHENYATLLQDFGQFDAAEGQWRRMLELLPQSTDACQGLANALDSQGKPVEAARWFFEALRRRPNSVEARNGLALALANAGRTEDAIRQFELALKQKPDFVEARVNLGQTLATSGRLDEAAAQYNEALRLNSNSAAANINLGKLLALQGSPVEAAARYRQAIRIKPDNSIAHYNLGNALNAMNQTTEAGRAFAEAARLRPAFAEARLNLGLALAKQGDNPGALAELSEAARLKPAWPDARFNYGVALARAGRFGEAAEQFRETLRLQPDNTQAKRFLEQAEARQY
jgi:tetratricopeptide (TPR) repeat protein